MNQFKNLISFKLEIKESRYDYINQVFAQDYEVDIDYSKEMLNLQNFRYKSGSSFISKKIINYFNKIPNLLNL